MFVPQAQAQVHVIEVKQEFKDEKANGRRNSLENAADGHPLTPATTREAGCTR